MTSSFFTELQQPGYLHVVINHIPIVGTAMGALAMCVALALRQRAALITALVIVFFSGLSAWPVYETGSAAYDPIQKISDNAGRAWLNEHANRAQETVWTFYAMAGLAAIALLAPARWPRTSLPLAMITTLAAFACIGISAYIAQAGGPIRHVEFRSALKPPPTSN